MGRHKSEPSAATGKNEIVKDKIRDYLADTWESLIMDIDQLEPKDRVDRRLKLMEYVMPKVQATKGEEKRKVSVAQSLLNADAEYDDWEETDTDDIPESVQTDEED